MLDHHQTSAQDSQHASHRNPTVAPTATACLCKGQEPHTQWQRNQQIGNHQRQKKGKDRHGSDGMAGN